ncbi:MAG TPA: hypothetical protein PKI11_06390 [Candidatus Hydrogenedentes bacterium]|nr:hypothetical protein [Candidatus Hydrogenedentota bacterium]HNT88576.1 hypothetical protein [Candidatus Hydrogenedentota bacterium]
MTDKPITVSINRIAVPVPEYIDARHSQEVADQVTARYKQIEDSSIRVDTLAFQLRTAYEFAVRVRELEDELRALNNRFIAELDGIHTRLQSIMLEARDSSPPPAPKPKPKSRPRLL